MKPNILTYFNSIWTTLTLQRLILTLMTFKFSNNEFYINYSIFGLN